MPLFKVLAKDRTRKILTLGKSIEELISTAKEKLELPDSEEGYVVVLEDDGTEIPDTETMEAYASSQTGTVTLMILEKHEPWKPKSLEELSGSMLDIVADVLDNDSISTLSPLLSESNNNSEKLKKQIAGSSTSSQSELAKTSHELQDIGISTTTSKLMLNTIPWEKFPKRLLAACERGLIPQPFDRRMMIQEVAQYLIDDLKDESRSAVAKVVSKIIKKYPHSFVEKIGNTIVGNGEKTLTTAIYNRVNYVRIQKVDSRNTTQNTHGSENAGKSAKKGKTPSRKNNVQADEYGCVEYEPSLPSTETEQSQEEKKKFLLDQATLFDNRDVVKMKIIFDETYPSQRSSINYRDGDVIHVLHEWPILMEPEYILQHASILLGKPINDIWRNNLKKNLVIHNFMKQYCLSQQLNRRKETSQVRDITDVLKESARLSSDMENNSALVLAIFPLLVLYFKEKPNYLYKIVDLERFTDEQVVDVVEHPSPTLLIKGESLYDPTATCAVIIETKVCFLPKDILQGILITFLSYYVFGLTYPDELFNTLEFIQRVLIDINPVIGKGGKAKKGSKRRTGTFGAAVKTLDEKLRQYDHAPE